MRETKAQLARKGFELIPPMEGQVRT